MRIWSVRPRASAAMAAATALLVAVSLVGSEPAAPPSLSSALADTQSGCTVVYAADASGAYAGNNEDEVNPLTNIWFVPGDDDTLGSMYVGYDDFVVQGGMNEAGLFFDALGVREVEVPATPGKPVYSGENLFVDLLTGCDSVACVLERYDSLSAAGLWNGQVLFGDRYGQSVIIEPLATIPMSGDFQVATNFFQSEVAPADRTDQRYVTATSMLADADSYSIDLMRDVMEATHQEGTVNTVYSTLYDLRAGVVHLSYFHDFTDEVTFNLADELRQGVHGYAISELFPDNTSVGSVAGPIRDRIAAAIDELQPATVTAGDVRDLAGTYEAESLVFMFEATDDGLAVRRPWTPWVDLVPLSPTRFARVTVDGAGDLHVQRLTFSLHDGERTVEISEDGVGSLLATSTDATATQTEWIPIAIVAAVVVAGTALIGWWVARTRGGPGLSTRVPPLAESKPHG